MVIFEQKDEILNSSIAHDGADWSELSGDLVRLVASHVCTTTTSNCLGDNDDDVVERVGGKLLAGKKKKLRSSFNDVLSMTQVCSSWREVLLEHPIQGMESVRFGLPKELVTNFHFCSLGAGRKKSDFVSSRIASLIGNASARLPGRLPKLVSRSAHWGNACAALVVAMVATENWMRNANSRGGAPKYSAGPASGWQQQQKLVHHVGEGGGGGGESEMSIKDGGFQAFANDLVQLWKRGARLGSKFAQAVLGEAFYCGGGAELSKIPCIQDIEQAILWLLRAVDYGDKVEEIDPMLARSELLLAYIYQDGQDGESSYSDYMLYGRSDRSVQESVFWFRRAAKHGSIDAQKALRSLYNSGQY